MANPATIASRSGFSGIRPAFEKMDRINTLASRDSAVGRMQRRADCYPSIGFLRCGGL